MNIERVSLLVAKIAVAQFIILGMLSWLFNIFDVFPVLALWTAGQLYISLVSFVLHTMSGIVNKTNKLRAENRLLRQKLQEYKRDEK